MLADVNLSLFDFFYSIEKKSSTILRKPESFVVFTDHYLTAWNYGYKYGIALVAKIAAHTGILG